MHKPERLAHARIAIKTQISISISIALLLLTSDLGPCPITSKVPTGRKHSQQAGLR